MMPYVGYFASGSASSRSASLRRPAIVPSRFFNCSSSVIVFPFDHRIGYPFYLFCEAALQRPRAGETEVPLCEERVGARSTDIAALARKVADVDPAAHGLFDRLKRVVHRRDVLDADVVRPLRKLDQAGLDRGGDGVVDEREVASLPTVAVEVHLFSSERRSDEPRECHVGSLPWTVDGEVP